MIEKSLPGLLTSDDDTERVRKCLGGDAPAVIVVVSLPGLPHFGIAGAGYGSALMDMLWDGRELAAALFIGQSNDGGRTVGGVRAWRQQDPAKPILYRDRTGGEFSLAVGSDVKPVQFDLGSLTFVWEGGSAQVLRAFRERGTMGRYMLAVAKQVDKAK